jgi:short chain dehydrogenase
MKFLNAYFLASVFGAVAIVHGFTVSKAVNTLRTGGAKSVLSMVADDAKVILVTGSSRGLGKSIALDLGAHGQKVVVNYVSDSSKAGAEATVEEIKALGGDAIAVQADSKLYSLNRGIL